MKENYAAKMKELERERRTVLRQNTKDKPYTAAHAEFSIQTLQMRVNSVHGNREFMRDSVRLRWQAVFGSSDLLQ